MASHGLRPRGVLLALAFALLVPVTGRAADVLSNVRRSVFKIKTVAQEVDYRAPWRDEAPQTGSGTGFFIGAGRILTNAHVVANARFITVQREGEAASVPARVIFIAHDADLAILGVSDAAYLSGVKPLPFGPLPRLRSPVSTIGYPVGGDQVSVTEGVVSRIGYRVYVHSGAHRHLLAQVDSAINPGNSGGPVVQRGAVVGVAFQSFTTAENTGYIIPVPVIERFLKDIEDGRYDGHPDDGLIVQDGVLNNPATAAFHGLRPMDGGVKVAGVSAVAPTAGLIKPGDILLNIDGQPIGVDGRIVYQGERVEFAVLFDLKQMGDEARFDVVRGAERLLVRVRIAPARPAYDFSRSYARRPRYLVYGGLLFEGLSRNFLETFGRQWFRSAPSHLRFAHVFSRLDDDLQGLEDVIVLVDALPNPVNTHVTEQAMGIVRGVDGVRVTSIAAMKERLESGQGEFVVIDFLGDVDPVVMRRSEAVAAGKSIEDVYGVRPAFWLEGREADGAAGDGR